MQYQLTWLHTVIIYVDLRVHAGKIQGLQIIERLPEWRPEGELKKLATELLAEFIAELKNPIAIRRLASW